MKGTQQYSGKQSGQTLIWVAFGLIALLGAVALAVDVGHIYAERRDLQNAADAGALAGARALCFGATRGDKDNAEQVAETYAEVNNGAPAATAWAELIDSTVTVTTSETAKNFFAGIVGVPTTWVGAVAAAGCGPATTACGLWPVAFRVEEWDRLYNNINGCGDSFFLWSGTTETHEPNCTMCDCDVDHDGRLDMVPIDERAWLDFSDVVNPLYPGCAQSGCGESELECWIERSNPAPVTIPACIGGDRGVRAGAKDDVDARAGDFVSISLFDSRGCVTDTCRQETYHAIRFGCVKVGGWLPHLELPYLPGMGSGTCWKDKAIEVSIDCTGQCETFCGSTPGGGCDPADGIVCATSLLK